MTPRNGSSTLKPRRLAIQYGRKKINYDLSYSSRKTLAIDVHPDLSVVVTAPKDADDSAVNEKMQKRASWIIKQQRFFENYLPTIPPRRYVSGESHRYLGRQYRLRVYKGDEDTVKMARGQINIHLKNPKDKSRIKPLVVGWFRQRSEIVFREIFDSVVAKAVRYWATWNLAVFIFPPTTTISYRTVWGIFTNLLLMVCLWSYSTLDGRILRIGQMIHSRINLLGIKRLRGTSRELARGSLSR